MLREHEVREMNERWADSFDDTSSEGLQKVAALNRQYIEDHIREGSFLDAVKEPEQITNEDCERSINTTSPIIIDEITDGQWAMPVDFTGSTRNEAVRQPKYAITIQKIQTAVAVYDTDEIRMSRRPITQHLKRDLGDALSDAKDRSFVINIETAVWFLYKDFSAGNAANGLNTVNIANGTVTEYSVFKSAAAKEVVDAVGNPANTWVRQVLRKSDFTDFQNAFNTNEGEQLIGATVLMTNWDFNRVSDWTIEEVGDATVKATVETTKAYKKFKDMTVVRTGKQRWLRTGNMYGFAPWSHLGRYFQLEGVKTDSDKRGTRVEMFAWMYIGLGFGNLMGLKKMENYSASTTPGNEDTILGVTAASTARPKVEEHVIRNNRVDTGDWLPRFTAS